VLDGRFTSDLWGTPSTVGRKMCSPAKLRIQYLKKTKKQLKMGFRSVMFCYFLQPTPEKPWKMKTLSDSSTLFKASFWCRKGVTKPSCG